MTIRMAVLFVENAMCYVGMQMYKQFKPRLTFANISQPK